MNTLSSLLNWIGNTVGANPATMTTSSKTMVGAVNELHSLFKPIRVTKTYTNLTMPSSKYLNIDSFAGLGVSTNNYAFCTIIRGWSGSVPYGVVKGSSGTDFYLTGDAGSISSITIEYWFFKYESIETQ